MSRLVWISTHVDEDICLLCLRPRVVHPVDEPRDHEFFVDYLGVLQLSTHQRRYGAPMMPTTPTDHSVDTTGKNDEPPGGWATAPTKTTEPLLSVVLCKYSGDKVAPGEDCQPRIFQLHPDEECRTLFFSVEALEAGESVLELPAAEVRGSGGDLTFRDPLT